MSGKRIECDFYIFNDGINNVHNAEVIKYISSKYRTVVDNLNNCAKIIANEIDENKKYLCVGEGGKKFCKALSRYKNFKNVELLIWHRLWSGDKEIGIETNIDNIAVPNEVVLIEDVIASGETINKITAALYKKGCIVKEVVSAVVSGNSKLLNESQINLKYAKIIGTSNNKDPFWFPAIYSYRHLFFGDAEMPDIYSIMEDKYFHGSKKLQQIILKGRDK